MRLPRPLFALALLGLLTAAHGSSLVAEEGATAFHIATLDGFGGEPSLAIAPDGTTYLAYPGATGSVVWKRAPGEALFHRLAVPNAGLGGSDEAIAVAPDGTLYVAGMYVAGPGFCSSITRSRDGGTTWDAPVDGACTLNLVDRPWIEVDEKGHVWLLQHSVCCLGQHDVHWSMDGITFLPVGIANPLGDFPGNLFADRARGMMYAATTCQDMAVCLTASPTDVPLAVWEPRGVIRTPSPTAGLNHVAGAVDEAGNLYLTWPALSGSSHVYLASSRDGGLTWSAPVRMSGGNAATFPWVAAGKDGHVALVWYEATRRGADPSVMPEDTQWHVYASLRAGWDAEWETVRLTDPPHHVGALCTRGASCHGLGLNRDLLDFFEADIGPDGRLQVAWPDTQAWVVRHAQQVSGPRLR